MKFEVEWEIRLNRLLHERVFSGPVDSSYPLIHATNFPLTAEKIGIESMAWEKQF